MGVEEAVMIPEGLPMCRSTAMKGPTHPLGVSAEYYAEVLSEQAKEAGVPLPEGSVDDQLVAFARALGVGLLDLCSDISSLAYYRYLENNPPTGFLSNITFLEGEEPEPDEEP